MPDYTLELDEPWTFLNARGNPIEGRRLTFRLSDGTIITVDVPMTKYADLEYIKGRLNEKIAAHYALATL